MSKLDLAIVLELVDKISAPAKKIKGMTGHLNKAIDDSVQSLKKLNIQQKQVKDFDKLSRKLNTQNTELNTAKDKFKQLQQQLKSTTKPTQALKNQVTKAAKQVHNLSAKQKELRIQLNNGRKSLKAQGIDTRNLTSAQKKLEQQLGETEKRYQRYQKLLRITQKGKQVAGKAIGGSKLALGAAGGGIAIILGQLRQAADEADKIAKISGNLKIDSFTLQAARFQGELNGVSSTDIDQALTRFSKRMGRLKNESGAIYGLLGKTDKAFANTLKNAGSNDQAFTLMTDYIANIKDAQKQSALADAAFGQTGRNMLIMLRQGKKGILDSRQEFAKFGGGASKSFQKNAENFNDALLRISILIKSIKFKALAPILAKVTTKLQGFLKQFNSSDGAKKFIDKMVAKVKKLIKVFEAIFTMTSQFFSLMSKVSQFVGGWENLALIMTSIRLLPVITALGTFIQLLTSLAMRQKIIAAAQWLWNAAINANVIANTRQFAIISALFIKQKALSAWTAIVTAGQWAWNIALNANPIGLVIAAVAALTAGALLLYKNWDTVISWFNKTLSGLADKFSFLGNLWNGLFGDKTTEVTQKVKQISDKTTQAKPTKEVTQKVKQISDKTTQAKPTTEVMQKAKQISDKTTQAKPTKEVTQKVKQISDKTPKISNIKTAISKSDISSPQIKKTVPLKSQSKTTVAQNSPISIIVNPAPGMDERQLANLVKQQLDQAKNNQQSYARSNLYDMP